jgi:hypothetical protein
VGCHSSSLTAGSDFRRLDVGSLGLRQVLLNRGVVLSHYLLAEIGER